MEALKINFDTDAVSTWSKRIQEAWVNNMKFSDHDAKEVRKIRSEIIISLVDQLFQIHGIVRLPTSKQIGEILRDIHKVLFQVLHLEGDLEGYMVMTIFQHRLGKVSAAECLKLDLEGVVKR